MLRWICFTLCALAVLLISFGVFVWSYRIDLIESAISRSIPPYKATVGAISFSKGTLTLKNVTFRNEDSIVHMQSIALTGSLSSWLSYAFLPTQKTLNLEKAVLSFSSIPSFDFTQGIPTILLHLNDVFLNNSQTSFSVHDFTGSISEMLTLQRV